MEPAEGPRTSHWRRRAQSTWKGIQRVYPAAAFIGGFLLDTFTLGQEITGINLVMLAGYWSIAFALLISIARGLWPAKRKWITLALQFCFGALFSALVVVYFLSSGSIDTFLFVALLTVLLVGNEFLQHRYEAPWLSWSLFTLAGIMFLNLVVPFVFQSVRPGWFLMAAIFAGASIWGLWQWSGKPENGLWGPIGVLVFSFALHWGGLLPPVPLVLKDSFVCRSMERKGGEITCLEEKQGLAVRWGLALPVLHRAEGERLFCLTSVFAPEKVKAELEHRWFRKSGEGWVQADRIVFKMEGGRKDGWRVFSNKRSLAPGEWKVETSLVGGARMGYVRFLVSSDPEPPNLNFRRRVLK